MISHRADKLIVIELCDPKCTYILYVDINFVWIYNILSAQCIVHKSSYIITMKYIVYWYYVIIKHIMYCHY